MGRVITPKYRIEMQVRKMDGGHISWTPMSWYQGRAGMNYGRPNAKNLAKVCIDMERSTLPGEANAHLGATCVISAQIVKQSTDTIVATYVRPTFLVL